MLIIILLHCNWGAAQTPFDCNGRMYRVLEEQGGTTFQEVTIDLDEQEATFEDRHFFRATRINGIAYRPADNLIYGVLLEAPYVLCRIDAEYNLERLAELPLPNNLLFVSGDVSPNERYLVLLGFSPEETGNLLALVDLESPNYPTTVIPVSKTNPDAALYCADIAFHPTLDKLYGFEHSERRLITIELHTGLVDNTTFPVTDVIRGNVPTIFFDAFGNLFGVGASEGTYSNRNLYRMDAETGEVALFDEMGFERNQDGCSCPFKVELLNRVSDRFAAPCTMLDFEFTLINRTDRAQVELRMTDTLPPGAIITHIDELPFAGAIVSGVGTGRLDIRDIQLPIGREAFGITVAIQEETPPTVVYNRAYLDNVLLTSLSETERILSDDPETAVPDDPTFFAIIPLDVDFDNIEPVLCPDDTLWLGSGVPGAETYLWSTGDTTDRIAVTEVGDYQVTVTSGCEEATGFIAVRPAEIGVDLGDDLVIERGEMVALVPSIQSEAPIRSYFWEESAENTLDCLTCSETSAQPTEDVSYQLLVENEFGCHATDVLQVVVRDFRVYAPTGFSPNGDRFNDRFYLQSRTDYRIDSWRIFDRWGNLVFERENVFSNDPAAGWDGLAKGEPMHQGVFAWFARVTGLDGVARLVKGEVTLVR